MKVLVDTNIMLEVILQRAVLTPQEFVNKIKTE